MATKREILGRPTVAQITRDKKTVLVRKHEVFDVWRDVARSNGYIIIDCTDREENIIPEGFFYKRPDRRGPRRTRTEAARVFMKHGPTVSYPAYNSKKQVLAAMKSRRKVPMHIREEQFAKAEGPYCGISYSPVGMSDAILIKVPLVGVVRGALLYAYSYHQAKYPIEVKPYAEAEAVQGLGAVVDVSHVPSATPKAHSYEFSISGVAVDDNDDKYVIAFSLMSDHRSKDKQHKKRFPYRGVRGPLIVFNWNMHDIAGEYATIDHYWNKEDNYFPFMMSVIPLPSQLFVDAYDFLKRNAVIWTKEHEDQDKPAFYPLNLGELEIMLHDFVQGEGHRPTLYLDPRKDGALRDLMWMHLNRDRL